LETADTVVHHAEGFPQQQHNVYALIRQNRLRHILVACGSLLEHVKKPKKFMLLQA
jgi:hypothetical protein